MQHLTAMDRARSALEQGCHVPSGALPVAVASSWQRCREGGLDPRARPRESVLPFVEVGRRRERNAVLRRLALAEMQLLFSQIAGSNFMIALGDSDGIVLDTLSDSRFAETSAGRSIIPGSVWNEGERGTNAFGLALLERQPAAIYGREHYFACHGHLSCMAAPILDAEGRVLGILDASCANEARQQHTHALVRMAASQIENNLIYNDRPEYFILAFHPRAEYLDTLSAGLLAVSNDGEIRSLNRAAATLLAGLPAQIGRPFEALFDATFADTVSALLKGGVIGLKDRAGSGVFTVCRQIGQGAGTRHASRPARLATTLFADEPDFVHDDPELARAVRDVVAAVRLRMPIHLTGETGTGKELMARHVHRASGRKGEFVAVNCGALPESLVVAELFGHERGAFTNARTEGAIGLVRQADGGTLFLDEVGDLPPAAQATLLRFLDTMEVRAIGGARVHRVDVQIVSATSLDLKERVAARAFRRDLFYRLNALTVHLPPLARRRDFAAVVRHLAERIAPGIALTDAAIAKLSQRAWPGNVRELHTTLQRAAMNCSDGYIDEDAFPHADDAPSDCCEDCRGHVLRQRRCAEIRSTYRDSGENVSRTARLLDLSRTTVYKHAIG